MKEPSRHLILVAWLTCGVIVAGLRFLNVTDLGYDLTLQFEAAQNLLAGKGLAIYLHDGRDLAEPARLSTLTHFPAGFSLLAAALLALGTNAAMVVKLVGATATILGWWGWALLGESLLAPQPRSGWRWLGLGIAIVTPLRYTPSWAGTDIVLWAAVPWILRWVVDERPDPWRRRLDAAVGAVCGLCLLMRYASLFVGVYAACLMLWQSRSQPVAVMRRWFYFGLGLVPAFALQLYVNYVMSNVPARPGGLGTQANGVWSAVGRLASGVPLLGAANYPWIFWLPGRAVEFLTGADVALPWRATIAVALIAAVAWSTAVATRDTRRISIYVAAIGIFVVLPAFLWACMTVSPYDYVADLRYYWPITPLAVLLVHGITSHSGGARRPTSPFNVYLIGYVVVGMAGIALLLRPGDAGAMQRTRLTGTPSFEHWRYTSASYETYRARQFVAGLLRVDPEAVLLTTKAQWFFPDPALDRSRVLPLRELCELREEYVTGPAHLIIVTFDRPGPDHAIWAWGPQNVIERAECLESLPGLELRARFPDERVKVFESRVPPGRLQLRR